MHRIVRSFSALVLLLACTAPRAQSTLGELLDAGAKRLTADEFRQEVVQRTIFGPSPTGGTMEVVYTASGAVTGTGTAPYSQATVGLGTQIDGEWSIDAQDRICTVVSVLGYGRRGGNLPPRCQYWFRLGEAFYFADSDTDRYAKVLRRSIKR